eukprot:61238_1
MAYWLGFLFADGNVHFNGARYRISLGLKCVDHAHVVKFAKALQSTYKVSFSKTNFNTCAVRHILCNDALALDLIYLGCTPKKSLTLKWPNNMPDEYAHYFVRDYLDGDGCIMFCQRRKVFRVSFRGTDAFIQHLQSYLKTMALIDCKARGSVSQSESCRQLEYGGIQSSIAVLNWIYKDSDESTRLNRKYALYHQFLEISDLKPNERLKPMTQFLGNDIYTTLLQCQHQHCCPQFSQLDTKPKINRNSIKIQQVDKIDLSVVKVWTNASTITKTLGFYSHNIIKVCKEEAYSAYGYIWKFQDDDST